MSTQIPSVQAFQLSDAQFVVPPGYITHSLLAQTAAIADHSARAALVDSRATGTTVINVPGKAGDIYTLIGVEIVNKSVLTTVVPTGGLVEISNDGIDWLPTEVVFNVASVAGANAGLAQTPTYIPMNKPLPAGSNISVYYTSRNSATDWLAVSLIYSIKQWNPAMPQTFFKSAVGTARSSVATFTSDGSVAIPANKGGNCFGFMVQTYGVVVTILNVGGIITAHNQAASKAWEPTIFCTGSTTSVGTGGGELPVLKWDCYGDAPGNSTFTFDFTTISTNSQTNEYVVAWIA